MTNTLKYQLAAFSIVALAAVFVLYFTTPKQASGNVLSYAVPRVATSSPSSAGPGSGVQQLVATSSNCVNRVISTGAQGVMLSFNGLVPTGSYGHWQGASTTVSYENGDFGCGAINVYAAASTSLNVTVLNQ